MRSCDRKRPIRVIAPEHLTKIKAILRRVYIIVPEFAISVYVQYGSSCNFCVCTAVHVILNFSAAFEIFLLGFLFLFIGILKAGRKAKKYVQ